jgi:S-adenosylmethionine hydrolase
MGLVTLLTDFGIADGYVGAMKGVLLERCPDVRIVDVSHAIPPGDVDAGAYVLRQAAPFYPQGTVHLAVVDPGVGSQRGAVVVETERHCFVSPDNGLLTLALEESTVRRAHAIENRRLWRPEVSPVFHGRDVFAPVAAWLASGRAIEEVGPPVDPETLVRRPWPPPAIEGDVRSGVVVYVDRFGNLVTNLPVDPAEVGCGLVDVAGQEIHTGRTYADVDPGHLLALRGSSGLLEIACNGRNAAERLGVGPGAVVTWQLRPGS